MTDDEYVKFLRSFCKMIPVEEPQPIPEDEDEIVSMVADE
jgi:hypothetical protein